MKKNAFRVGFTEGVAGGLHGFGTEKGKGLDAV